MTRSEHLRRKAEQDRRREAQEKRLAAQQRREEREKRRLQREAEGRELAKGPIDLPFLLLVCLLLGIGLIMVFSASFPSAYYSVKIQDPFFYIKRQGMWAILGLCAMVLTARIDYHRFKALSKPALFVAIILLALVLVPGVGTTRNHATRWIEIGGLSMQPSEVAKFAVALYFADSISKKREKMRSFRYGILPYGIILVLIAALMMLEPHLSGTVLILGTGAVMMVVGGIPGWLVGAGIGGVFAAAAGYIKAVELGIIHYGASRIQMWEDPFIDRQGDGYQMVQSLLSIGSGGLLGVGLGKSRQKFLYLPEEHNDFIFSIVCEELGLIGATIIMLLFAALILRGYWIALHARDRFGSLLVVGMTTFLGLQVFLNIGVVTGLLPATGISLPFFSYGGTALCIQLVEMGVVLSVSRQMKPGNSG